MHALIKKVSVVFQNELKKQVEKYSLNKLSTNKCKTSEIISSKSINISDIFKEDDEESFEKLVTSIDHLEIPDGTGGVNLGDRKALFFLIKHFLPNNVLEVGTHIGASTVHLAFALSKFCGTGYSLITVDLSDVNDDISKPWERYGTRYSPLEMIKGLNLKDNVNFVTKSSIEFLKETNQKFNFIFLDGNHSAEIVYQEVPLALNLLEKDGVILLHDYFPDMKPLWSNGKVIPGPYLAIQKLKSEGADLSVIPLGELPWPTKFNSRLTSLALLTKN